MTVLLLVGGVVDVRVVTGVGVVRVLVFVVDVVAFNVVVVAGLDVDIGVDTVLVVGVVTGVVAVVVLVLVVTGQRVVVLLVNAVVGTGVGLVAVGVDGAPCVSNLRVGACSSVSNLSMGAFCSVSNFSMGASPSWSSWYWPRARSGRTP